MIRKIRDGYVVLVFEREGAVDDVKLMLESLESKFIEFTVIDNTVYIFSDIDTDLYRILVALNKGGLL